MIQVDNEKFQNLMMEQMAAMMQSMTVLTSEFQDLKCNVQSLEGDVQGLRDDIVRLENKLHEKTTVLFDAIQQHTALLQRIEEKVSTHEEFIMKRIK